MANKTIDEVTPKGSAAGSEVLPISDSGTAKSITTANIKDYVLGAIAALTSADSTTLAEDEIYIKQDGAMKKVSAATLAEAVYARLYGKTAQDTFAETDVISLKSGNDYKTTTMTALTAYLAEEINPTFDIHAMSNASALVGGDTDCEEVAVSQKSGDTWNTLKTTIANLANYVIGKLKGVSEQNTAIENNDYFLIQTGSDIKKVKRTNAGITNGDVIGPNDALKDGIPQWNAANSKELKAGLSVTLQVSSSSSELQIPTASAVHTAISEATTGMVSGPQTTTENKIPQWDSTTKLLKNGLSVQNTIRASGTAESTAVPTEAAVRGELDGKVMAPNSTTQYKIPQWGAASKALTDGLTLQTTIRTADQEAETHAEDTAIATELAVARGLAGKANIYGTPNNMQIMQWNNSQSAIVGGYSPVIAIDGESTNTEIATALAVKDYVDAAIAAHLAAYTHTPAS